MGANWRYKEDPLGTFRAGLPTRQLVRASDLAHRWNVSRRTIYRWMERLRDEGVKIRGDRGIGYWVYD